MCVRTPAGGYVLDVNHILSSTVIQIRVRTGQGWVGVVIESRLTGSPNLGSLRPLLDLGSGKDKIQSMGHQIWGGPSSGHRTHTACLRMYTRTHTYTSWNREGKMAHTAQSPAGMKSKRVCERIMLCSLHVSLPPWNMRLLQRTSQEPYWWWTWMSQASLNDGGPSARL